MSGKPRCICIADGQALDRVKAALEAGSAYEAQQTVKATSRRLQARGKKGSAYNLLSSAAIALWDGKEFSCALDLGKALLQVGKSRNCNKEKSIRKSSCVPNLAKGCQNSCKQKALTLCCLSKPLQSLNAGVEITHLTYISNLETTVPLSLLRVGRPGLYRTGLAGILPPGLSSQTRKFTQHATHGRTCVRQMHCRSDGADFAVVVAQNCKDDGDVASDDEWFRKCVENVSLLVGAVSWCPPPIDSTTTSIAVRDQVASWAEASSAWAWRCVAILSR